MLQMSKFSKLIQKLRNGWSTAIYAFNKMIVKLHQKSGLVTGDMHCKRLALTPG